MDIRSINEESPLYGNAVMLLEQAGLPTADLPSASIELFGICERGSLNGVVGLEALGNDGLLRSLVVEPGVRGRAIAQRLCEAVFAYAEQSSMQTLYLITVDADAYFKRFAFEVVSRDHVPPQLRESTQFATLCPDTAIVMRRSVSS